MSSTSRGEARPATGKRGSTGSRATAAEDAPPAPRTGAKRTVLHYMRQLPNYVRLLGGLLTDRRVSMMDKLLVGGAIAYIVMPIDLIPDFIPFLGEVDDVFILVLALQRLVGNAGRSVLLAHWSGAAEDLADLNLREALAAAAFFLPRRLRRRLRVIGR
ncbi:MAG TPA: YkvA family protein [Gemmatimonadaceae bacterium]